MLDINELTKISVEQLENKNQFVIRYRKDQEQIICFQSYRTLIAMYNPVERKMYINYNYWDYSKTTSKHLKIFINEYTPFTYESRLEWLKQMQNNPSLVWFKDND